MCLFPQLIRNKKYTPNKKNGGFVDYSGFYNGTKDKRVLAVPIGCGDCIKCRKQKAREWQVRLLEHVKENRNGKFITLTFSNESIKELVEKIQYKETKVKIGEKTYIDKKGNLKTDKNGKVIKRYKYRKHKEKQELRGYDTDNAIATYATRKFLERWRKKFGKSVQHWLITELGHKGTQNIHMHGFMWTNESTEEIAKIWKYGWVWTGKRKSNGRITNYVTERTVNYVTKYVTKRDIEHKHYKAKILTSAGIGACYQYKTDWENLKFKGKDTKEYYRTSTRHKMALPIYYRNKRWSDDEREQLWINKLDEQVRYVGRHKIDISENMEEYYRAVTEERRKNDELGYGTSTKDWNQKKYEEQLRNLLIQKRIGEKEDRATEVSRRGASPTGEAFALDDNEMIWKWDEKELYYDEKTVYNDEGEPDWVTSNGEIISW